VLAGVTSASADRLQHRRSAENDVDYRTWRRDKPLKKFAGGGELRYDEITPNEPVGWR